MHPHPYEPPVEFQPTEAETIALAYQRAARGDAWVALVCASEDAQFDLAEAERRSLRRDRLVSCGYVRASLRGTVT